MRVRLSVPAGVWTLSLRLPGEGRRCEDGAERDDGKKRFHRMFHGSSPEMRHRSAAHGSLLPFENALLSRPEV
jgi:hypothetical protein